MKPRRVRFDDAIWATGDKQITGKEVQKFIKNVNWCVGMNVPLTPAILCQEIEKFPEGIEWIRQKCEEGLLYPDLHGWDHGPYGDRSQVEIETHLDQSCEWLRKHFGRPPIRWVTPHGADSPDIRAAARKFHLLVETTADPVMDQKRVDTLLRQTRDLSFLTGKVIMNHWWERGLRLYRIGKIVQYQSVDEAILATKAELDEKSYRICWNGWEDEDRIGS
jgi:hypothetical protein